jgi:hypothetical protein
MEASKMNSRLACHECEAIAREIREAYADAWISGDQAFRDASMATLKLIGGTEEDAARAEVLIALARPRTSLGISQTFRRKFAHQARSGHKITWFGLLDPEAEI